ncbi:FAD binding domain-containing protein [Plectosphaerella plurivora]|uniref:FAD binding domain-containing protein n=1 Tax=Plectosphaerella plurivora TaxID=936078 RepID=A0A9P8VIL8_9PEZI|nr:FAD binding domain-containing protein [Plectosphaerella plurivora]
MARFGLLAASAALLCSVHAQTAASEFPSCDILVSAGLSDILYYPDDTEYQASITSYWSGTVQAVRPWCIVRPRSTAEVAAAFKALVAADAEGEWDIAVRGGGHSHWASNNVGNGTTIDLSLLNAVTYNNCTQVAKIGAGARWGAVFAKVESFGRTVTGGREGNVGVAGLTLGGGASFHSAHRGFACDDIVNYEVVLADGSVVQANTRSYTDLFKALKGGGNNFGIVTRFDMATFEPPAQNLWGGLLFMMYDQKDAILRQLNRFIDINSENRDDSETVTFTWTAGAPEPQIAMIALNMAGLQDSPSFTPLENVTTLMDDRRSRTYGEMIRTYISAAGPRSVWYSTCFHNRLDILQKAASIFEAAVARLAAQYGADSGVGLNIVVQPLGKHFAVPGAGRNVLGLDKTLTHDSVIWLVQSFSSTAEQEAVLVPIIAEMTAELEAYVESQNANTPWRYYNYVNQDQHPLESYGAENVRFLKAVAAKYDPAGVFQTRVPGGFKLSHIQ